MPRSHFLRIQKSQKEISPSSALLVSDPLDIYYLTGFICLTPEEREAYVLLTHDTAYLFLSSFSTPTEVEGLQVHIGGVERVLREKLPIFCEELKLNKVLIDGNSLRFNEYEFIKSLLPSQVKIIAANESTIATQRIIKDRTEIESITKANAITHAALNTVFTRLEVGMTETEVQKKLEKAMRDLGVTEFAFPTIVCFGKSSALPHHQPDDTKLTPNQPILIDCGAKWQKYCADVTRTVWFGDNPEPQFIEIENIVKTAYDKTLSALKNRKGILSKEKLTAAHLDKIARDHINKSGYGQNFIHTTGHGVGLYIHEQPSLNQRNMTDIKPGMIITIEPGIYLEEKFGYRFENSILVTEDSAEELL